MWTGYSRKHKHCDLANFAEYPEFVFIEHLDFIDAADIFTMYFGHHPHEYGKPNWDLERDEDLMPLLGGLIDCSKNYSESSDSFSLSHSYFIDKERYVDDMDKLNVFLKGDVLILSEMEVNKW